MSIGQNLIDYKCPKCETKWADVSPYSTCPKCDTEGRKIGGK